MQSTSGLLPFGRNLSSSTSSSHSPNLSPGNLPPYKDCPGTSTTIITDNTEFNPFDFSLANVSSQPVFLQVPNSQHGLCAPDGPSQAQHVLSSLDGTLQLSQGCYVDGVLSDRFPIYPILETPPPYCHYLARMLPGPCSGVPAHDHAYRGHVDQGEMVMTDNPNYEGVGHFVFSNTHHMLSITHHMLSITHHMLSITSHAKHHTSHAKHHTSHAKCHTSHAKHHTSHAKHHTSHAKHHTSHAKHHTSHAKHHTSHAKHHTSHAKHHTSHAKHHTSHAKHHTSHAKHHTSHAKHHTSHAKHHTSHAKQHTSHAKHHTSHAKHHTSHAKHHTSHAKRPYETFSMCLVS